MDCFILDFCCLKVDIKLGLAADSLESLIMNGESGRYDDSKHQDYI
jgi:hypothetical protein